MSSLGLELTMVPWPLAVSDGLAAGLSISDLAGLGLFALGLSLYSDPSRSGVGLRFIAFEGGESFLGSGLLLELGIFDPFFSLFTGDLDRL